MKQVINFVGGKRTRFGAIASATPKPVLDIDWQDGSDKIPRAF